MAIYKLGDEAPTIHESVFLADTATIIGRVTLEENASVWFGAALRGDNEPIVVGRGSNVQEDAILHADPGFPLTIEANVTVGHQAMLHGCTIKEGSLIGIQAVVLNGAVIGRNCLVGAGAVVTEGKVFPDNTLILGSPAKAIREITEADIARMQSATAQLRGPTRILQGATRADRLIAEPASRFCRRIDQGRVVNDQLQKFMFNAAPVRGEIVSLRNTWQEVLARRSYPVPVRNLLGEMMAACALLSANLKFDGTLIMQIYGDGPVRMLVVQCNSDLSLRATAKLAAGAEALIGDDMTLPDLLNQHGHGRCVITLDPGAKKPGTAAVSRHRAAVGRTRAARVDGRSAGTLHASFRAARHAHVARGEHRSRGRACCCRSCRATAASCRIPASMMRIRGSASAISAARCRATRLLKEEPETVFRRLFWQENVQHFEPAATRFQCSCSREKVGAMLKMLGREEVDGVIDGARRRSKCIASSATSATSSIRSTLRNFLSQKNSHKE